VTQSSPDSRSPEGEQAEPSALAEIVSAASTLEIRVPNSSAITGGVASLSPDWRLRVFELALVCSIAFGGSILASVAIFFGEHADRSGVGTLRWLNMGLLETAALALVWYVLRQRASSFRDLGFTWTKKDVAWSIPLWILGMTAFSTLYYAIYSTGLASATGSEATSRVASLLFGQKVSFLIIPFQFLNPFFEELIARAYVMTAVRHLTKSMPLAVIFSTVLQMSYHFYQGAPLATADGALFLVFSLFYAKTNRITPVVLAHFYIDILSTLRIWFAQG
jgi:membrane protease YdiL (CAAX protease family)